MAGIKRKLDTAQGSAASASPANASTGGASHNASHNDVGDDTPSIRVTRSLRSSRDARASQNDNHKTANAVISSGTSANHHSSNTPSNNKHGGTRPSRIITLRTRAAGTKAPSNASTPSSTNTPTIPNSSRETRNSRSRAAAPAPASVPAPVASSQSDGVASNSIVPETPRHKRVKRGSVAEETPSRTTRQSARIKAQSHPTLNDHVPPEPVPAPKLSEVSPSATVAPTPSTRTRTRSRQFQFLDTNDSTRSPTVGQTAASLKPLPSEDVAQGTAEPPKPLQINSSHDFKEHQAAIPQSPKGTISHDHQDYPSKNTGLATEEGSETIPNPPSLFVSRKRKPSDEDDHGATSSSRASSSPSKKPKLEDGALEPEPLNNNQDRRDETPAPTETAVESKVDGGSRQITEEIESTPDNVTESTVGRLTVRTNRNRGRGRGGARNRGSARLAANKRGRGGTRSSRGGRTGRQYDRSSDVELERSPSPSAATQRLRDRQRELDKTFRRVAAAQRLALAVLASQSEKRLARDKNAHVVVPEYVEVCSQLEQQLKEKKELLRREFMLKVEQENHLFQANKEAIEERFRASARYIQEEHLFASQGDYMTFIEGRRAAEDDEHTETDGSESDSERGHVAPPTREVIRGFNSSAVRAPAGAISYERAAIGWEDFIQRAKLGDDIDPQMKQMKEAGPLAGLSAEDLIKMLLEATDIIEFRGGVPVTKEINPPIYTDVRALSALADAAAAEIPRHPIPQPTPRLSTHRTILPQPSQPQIPHGPPEPRPFVLPPPTPHRGQQRRLLPAGQQIPPINEQLGLPDPFAARGGPPQLPPPPGSNFQRPPLPGFMTGHHPQSLYYPPPPPPPPPGTRPPY